MKPEGELTLSLTPELERFVKEEARRGAFASSSDYVSDLVRERCILAQEGATKLGALEASLAQGIADAKAGRVMPIDEAFERLRAELAALPADGGS